MKLNKGTAPGSRGASRLTLTRHSLFVVPGFKRAAPVPGFDAVRERFASLDPAASYPRLALLFTSKKAARPSSSEEATLPPPADKFSEQNINRNCVMRACGTRATAHDSTDCQTCHFVRIDKFSECRKRKTSQGAKIQNSTIATAVRQHTGSTNKKKRA